MSYDELPEDREYPDMTACIDEIRRLKNLKEQ